MFKSVLCYPYNVALRRVFVKPQAPEVTEVFDSHVESIWNNGGIFSKGST